MNITTPIMQAILIALKSTKVCKPVRLLIQFISQLFNLFS